VQLEDAARGFQRQRLAVLLKLLLGSTAGRTFAWTELTRATPSATAVSTPAAATAVVVTVVRIKPALATAASASTPFLLRHTYTQVDSRDKPKRPRAGHASK
jgi:hypothetical protein